MEILAVFVGQHGFGKKERKSQKNNRNIAYKTQRVHICEETIAKSYSYCLVISPIDISTKFFANFYTKFTLNKTLQAIIQRSNRRPQLEKP